MKELRKEIKEKLKDKRRVVAASAYLIFFLPRFTEYRTDPEIHFHMKQGVGLLVTSLSLQGISSILGGLGMPAWRGLLVNLFVLYMLYVGISNVLYDRKKVLPWIGKYADRAFEGSV